MFRFFLTVWLRPRLFLQDSDPYVNTWPPTTSPWKNNTEEALPKVASLKICYILDSVLSLRSIGKTNSSEHFIFSWFITCKGNVCPGTLQNYRENIRSAVLKKSENSWTLCTFAFTVPLFVNRSAELSVNISYKWKYYKQIQIYLKLMFLWIYSHDGLSHLQCSSLNSYCFIFQFPSEA